MSANPGYPSIVSALLMISVLQSSCKTENKSQQEIVVDTTVLSSVNPLQIDYDTTQWREITNEDGFYIDIKYATTDNFVKAVIYPCGRFFLRPEVANALDRVKNLLLPQGYKLKLFDGYRPRPAQQILWDKVPNPLYVAPPAEGSMHNRGVAIDLTLTDIDGKELDMGTPYDFFGREAHHDYTQLPGNVLSLRHKLKSVMESCGFQSISSEWWHYSYESGSYPLDDWQWPCIN